ncbi:MAG: response regulator [Deltaproteobacteria bacterium]|nr:response regulator [Deltaproteobacteria bacterium]
MGNLKYNEAFVKSEKKFQSPMPVTAPGVWKILIIDDEPCAHDITELVLKDFHFKQKPLSLLHAYSAKEARIILETHEDVVLILLDIILETETAGLELIHWIRKHLKNKISQIVIRTGKPENFSEQDMIEAYDVNDYIVKTDVTAQRLKTLITGSIRTFVDKLELKKELNVRKLIEQSLKEKEILLKDIIENIGDILWEINVDMKYVYISEKAENITGFSKSEQKKRRFSSDMTLESKKNSWPEIQKKIMQEKKFSNIEISRTTKNGDIQYYLTSGKPFFNEKNELKGYRGADINITDLKNSELEKEKLIGQLRHAQRLEAMGTLAGGIAHDFNNILGGILGYAQLLQFELSDNQNCLSYTRQIVTGCNRAKNLIFQILDFSRQSENLIPQNIANPIEIVEETLKLLRASFPSSIKLHSNIDKNTGCIKADPSQIHQAVMNLCTNARQAIKSGIGHVTIIVRQIIFSSDNPIENLKTDLPFGEYICISVEDTGEGIETDTLDKIFNPYFTTKDRGDGTGLGLSVVHGIVTRFSGAVTTRTRPGEGTVFALYFPKYLKKKKKEKTSRNILIKGKACVLFIDDEPMLVNLGKMMLEKLGYKVVAKESALSALKMIKKSPEKFDIIITDMTMPDIHGTQLAVEIKKINKKIPIVLATGFTNIIQTEKPNPSGIDAILPKPIEINTLSQTLHQLLAK